MILVDTNVLVAVANTRDNYHQAATQLLESEPGPLLVAPTVIAEVCYLLSERAGPTAEVSFLRAFQSGELDLAQLTPSDIGRMADLAEDYADLGLGGTDASVVAIAERLGITTIATFDRRHFSVVRPNHVEFFTLLPSVAGERQANVAVTRLEALAGELRSATHLAELPTEVATIYPALGEVVDLLRTLEAATRRLSESVAGLPGIVGGLRIDTSGEPVTPESVRDQAVGDLAAAARSLDSAQDAVNRAWQSMGRLYMEQS